MRKASFAVRMGFAAMMALGALALASPASAIVGAGSKPGPQFPTSCCAP